MCSPPPARRCIEMRMALPPAARPQMEKDVPRCAARVSYETRFPFHVKAGFFFDSRWGFSIKNAPRRPPKTDPFRHRFFDRFLINFGSILGGFWEAKLAPRRPKTAPRRPKTPQDAAKTPQDGAKMRPRRHQDGERRHVEPSWFQEGFGTRKY